MRIDVFTIFPELVADFFEGSLLGKATRSGAVDLRVHDIRAQCTRSRIGPWTTPRSVAGQEWSSLPRRFSRRSSPWSRRGRYFFFRQPGAALTSPLFVS